MQINNGYVKEFNAGYQTWLENKFIGDGVKSFKKNCPIANVKNCGAHPHNYYLEILSTFRRLLSTQSIDLKLLSLDVGVIKTFLAFFSDGASFTFI